MRPGRFTPPWPEEREEILLDLGAGRLDAIVQVQMLGEGFDHPPLSVAAVFRPFRSLSPYIQFIGRIMRVNVQNAPGHQDNQGVVVSHVGLNVDRYWEDFKQIDQDDQELVAGWLEAEDTAPPTGKRRSRRRLRPDMNVTQEIIDRFISDPYLDPNDDTLIDNALIVLREQGIDLVTLGIDREDLRQRMLSARAKAGPQEPERLPVQPQAHRKVLRARLREQAKSAAARICEALGHRVGGRRIAALGGTGAANNLAAVIALMNRAVNDRLGIDSGQRRDLTIDELETVIPLLDDIADEVESDLRSRLAK